MNTGFWLLVVVLVTPAGVPVTVEVPHLDFNTCMQEKAALGFAVTSDAAAQAQQQGRERNLAARPVYGHCFPQPN